MGMFIDESYDTEVSQNRRHSPRHRTTFLTRRPLLPTLMAFQPVFFFCAFYHTSAYSPLLQAVFCITRTTNTTMSFVIVVSKTSPARRGKKNRDIARRFTFFRGDTRAST